MPVSETEIRIYFPGLMAAFRKKYPEVVFTMKLGDPSAIFPGIRSGELDFGLVDVFLTRDQIQDDFGIYSIEPLIDEEVVLACCEVVKGDKLWHGKAMSE